VVRPTFLPSYSQDNEPRLPKTFTRSAASSFFKMLASRVLPPIVLPFPLPPIPVATFFIVPRRNVKSNMQVGDNSPQSSVDEAKPSRNLRKSSRINESRSAPISNPAERVQKEEPLSPAVVSPKTAKKRLPSFVEVAEAEESGSPLEERPPPSATSAGSPDFSGHVCLCQPEPKIPRPRNGESDSSLFLNTSFVNQVV
jgi:hypothetical protein